MPKSLMATGLQIEGLSIQTDETDLVCGLTTKVNVAYGETQVREDYDIWADMSATKRDQFQSLYTLLVQRLNTVYFG